MYRSVGGFFLAAALLAAAYFFMGAEKEDNSESIKMDLIVAVNETDDPALDKDYVKSLIEIYHQAAFEKAYDMGEFGRRGRRRGPSFDPGLYLNELFDMMKAQASRDKRPTVAKYLDTWREQLYYE